MTPAPTAPHPPPWPPPAGDTWVTPTTRTAGPAASSLPDLGGRRALPTSRRGVGRLDLAMLASALVLVGSAVNAYLVVKEPWVTLTITDTSDRANPVLVGDITLRGHGAFVGTAAMGLAIAIGVIGVLCLLHAFDRGSTMRWFANPAIAIVAGLAGLGGGVLSAVLWFVWEDAAIARSRAVKLPAEELRALLASQPAPLVEIQRLAGLMRFGGAMLVALLAASGAWWAYHKRS